MPITIKYFASLRETLGRGEDTLDAAVAATVGEVWARATEDRSPPPNLLAAVNQEYTDFEQPVSDGDEVAFFPPVTGG
ncbi:MAG: MoaD/ThiS family protein [Candidatus Binatia bacterium]